MKSKTVLLWAIALFLIDQTIKIVIDRYFLDVRFDIIPSLFYFKPSFNHNYSYINGLFGLGLGFWTHIIFMCIVAILLIVIYYLFKTISGNAKLVNIAFIFGFAGLMSSLIGTVLWDGCLDYIFLKPLFVFDLKDLYLNAFAILFLFYYHKNRKYLASIKGKDIIHHFRNK